MHNSTYPSFIFQLPPLACEGFCCLRNPKYCPQIDDIWKKQTKNKQTIRYSIMNTIKDKNAQNVHSLINILFLVDLYVDNTYK